MHIKLPTVYEESVLSLISKVEQCDWSGNYTETLGRVHVLAGAVLCPTLGSLLAKFMSSTKKEQNILHSGFEIQQPYTV